MRAFKVNAQGRVSGHGIQFLNWELVVEVGAPINVLQHFDPVSFRVRDLLTGTDSEGKLCNLVVRRCRTDHLACEFRTVRIANPARLSFSIVSPPSPIKPGAYRWKAGVFDGHQWTDGWWGLPEMVVATKPMTNTGDEFQGILNLPCEMEVRSALKRFGGDTGLMGCWSSSRYTTA